MASIINNYNPDYVIHPGEYLEEILDSREIKKRDFAERVGLSVKAVSQIINRKALFSPEIALRFEKTLDVSAEIWVNLADTYQLFEAKLKERKNLETAKTKEWVRGFPTADLKRMGLLPESTKPEILADGLLRFFNISNPEVWDEYMQKKAVSYRRSTGFSESKEATAVWLRLAERDALKMELTEFDRNQFKESLIKIRDLTLNHPKEFFPRVVELCRHSGVALILVPELKGTHISGAACWLTQNKAMIAVSPRFKANDHFWFTFFHEAAHILFHGKKNIYIDLGEGGLSGEELEANTFSREILIPQKEYEDFTARGHFYLAQIKAFAARINLHPGIVVGRLQHEGLIEFNWHNDLKEKFTITGEKDEKEGFSGSC